MRTPRRVFASVLVSLVAASGLGIVGPTNVANAGTGPNLEVQTWDIDVATGTATYALEGSATCDSSCFWSVQAVDRSGPSEVLRKTLDSKSYSYGGPITRTITGSVTGEVTHVVAGLTENGMTTTHDVQVSGPYPPGTVTLAASRTGGNADAGYATWEAQVTASGMGSRASPCVGWCYFSVQAVDRSGPSELIRKTLWANTYNSGLWQLDKTVTGSTTGEVTHIVANVYGNELTWTYEVAVDGTFPEGTLDLEVGHWSVDGNGNGDWRLHAIGSGMASRLSPCLTSCFWSVQAVDRSVEPEVARRTFWNNNYTYPLWQLDKELTSSGSVGNVTHLVVTVTGNGMVWTRDVPVSNRMLMGFDYSYGGNAAAATVLAMPATVQHCDPLLTSGGPSLNGNSLPDSYETCIAAVEAGGISLALLIETLAEKHGPETGDAVFEEAWRDVEPDDPPPSPLPELEPAADGSGAKELPPGCLSEAEKQAILDDSDEQDHHLATHYGAWGKLFQAIADFYGLSLNGDWNIIRIEHKGGHPDEYHYWVWRNMKEAQRQAGDDVDLFLDLFEQWVRNVVDHDRTIVRNAWWRC